MRTHSQPGKTGNDSTKLVELHRALDKRPLLFCVAGPNGAGKTTFFHAHVEPAGLRYICADAVARELDIDSYEAARIVTKLRQEMVNQRESFVFETVLSDPVGEKVDFLKKAAQAGFSVVLSFIGVSGPEISEQRVSMRVAQGGHDVPVEKLISRFPRTLINLRIAIRELPFVLIYDNDNLCHPFRRIAVFENGQLIWSDQQLPGWLKKQIR